jgi:hypothetical protein
MSHELSYLGGIIDGEGSIGWYSNKYSGRNPTHFPRISVGMTDFEPIYLLQSCFGGGISKGDKQGEHYKLRKIWMVSHRKAAVAARILSSFTEIKRNKLNDIVLAYFFPEESKIKFPNKRDLDNLDYLYSNTLLNIQMRGI